MKKIIIFGLLLLLNSCQNQQKDVFVDSCPQIMLIPCNGFSKKEAWKIASDITFYLRDSLNKVIQIEVDTNSDLPDSLMNKKRTRYNARKIIDYFQSDAGIIYVALLKQNIFKYKEDGSEWGILGQSVIGGNSCVVSSHRVRNKDNMWKLVLHEYCHTRFKYYHCPNDDPKCFMKDAKGKADLEAQKYFCNDCKKAIKF